MKIEIVPIVDVSIHPALKHIPPAPDELIDSLVVDLDDREPAPLICDEKLRVIDIDSADRLKARIQLDYVDITVIRRPENEIFATLISSIALKRNYSKSAVAYVLFPFFEPALEEARRRQSTCLKQGDSRSTQNVLRAKTAEEIARSVGVSRALFFQARDVHKLFRKNPELRESIEPKILSGDLSLGYAINGIAGLIHTKGKPRANSDQLELFESSLVKGVRHLRDWSGLSEAKKRHAVAHFTANFLPSLPPEFHRAYRRFLREHEVTAVK